MADAEKSSKPSGEKPTPGNQVVGPDLSDIEHSSTADNPNLITFSSPTDPLNPLNWPPSKKLSAILIITLTTLLSPIGSTISAAAGPTITSSLSPSSPPSETLTTLITTIYLLGYTSGPLAIAPLSELYGRSILYKICISLFLLFNIACALAPSVSSLIAFRFLAGIAGSCPVTLGTASIADMVVKEKRGGAMAGYIIGAVLGPALGPVAGGYLVEQGVSWRWVFWVMAIATGPLAVVIVLELVPGMAESYAVVLLRWKTERLRRETGNGELRSVMETGRERRGWDLVGFAMVRPVKMLLGLPIVGLLSLYAAVVYSYLYLCFTTFGTVFGSQYGLGTGAAGLAPLGIGVGSVAGVVFCGLVSDRLSAYLARKYGGDVKPEYRLPVMVIGGVCVPVGLFWYGWTAEYKLHWMLAIVGTGFLGVGMVITYMASTMYLVDAYTIHAASVTAASTVLRSLSATFLPLAGPAMYNKLGVGWGNSLLGFVSLAFLPLPFIFYRYGQRIREAKPFKVEI